MTNKDKTILIKIISYINDINDYIDGFNYDAFIKDKKTLYACSFSISQIGELTNELSDLIQNNNSHIPWKSIKGMRNKIVHDYENVDLAVLWGTITKSLPLLIGQLNDILG